ncbi:MAG: site-2 protease family protein [Deltaproteobacteria bacterium HGW-Deltaproteobacteria-21]|nr:MAG: site-2 protease family protein [Deltaproteobacteria bacterium HGW-Deltaproteobacteria-21]PKN62363.1 MAG: site-2 protease family protein [Deltaproteobacteria bacterium HGW-Deltaproteobacteria-15]
MFGKRFNLFRLMGFQVRIDLSWIFIAVLISWSLSTGFFPFYYQGLNTGTYWIMGVVGALGLFLSIIVHEFSHSLVARKYGMPMKGITLFIFGGMAEMGDEPPSSKAEFMMAVIGPISSIVIAGIFYGVYAAGGGLIPQAVNGVIGYLSFINAILAAFNIIPAFPLDGGRVLRSLLWGIKGDLRWATRISSFIGSAFGILLIFMGIVSFFSGNFIGGMWWFLIGMFLNSAARMSYQQLLTRRALEGESVSRFMTKDPVTVSRSTTLESFVNDYVYRYQHKMFPVVSDSDQMDGCITTAEIKAIPREEWKSKRVGDILKPCSTDTVIPAETDAVKALSLMNRTGSSRLLVVEGNRLAGVISLKDMLKFLSLKVEMDA